jgi:hypothetical protein
MMLWRRSLAVWAVIAFAETLHGIGRTLLVQPYLGDLRARQVAVFTGSLMILAIAALFVRWIGAKTVGQLLGVGFVWVVLMAAFEIGLGRILGMSWQRIAADYDPRQGGLMLVGMAVLLFAPLIAGRVRSPR